ncbi:hypothetical protein BMS3Bbin11_00422 [bacterium BMS3Bbin11]|nr:hypothetical protein BMS3Bbin11_00422 [bacterium BMS3Bbin11]
MQALTDQRMCLRIGVSDMAGNLRRVQTSIADVGEDRHRIITQLLLHDRKVDA